VKIGETTGTAFTDSGLLDGFEYLYTVMPVGAQDSCLGPMSACTSAIPLSPQMGAEAVLSFREAANPFEILTGDGDAFLDNCERGRFDLHVENTGSVTLHNVRVSSIVPVSHPQIEILTPLPQTVAATLEASESCAAGGSSAPVSFSFRAHGLGAGETVELRIEVVSDETSAAPLIGTIRLPVPTEGDFQFFASRTFQFETGLEGWEVTSGTFNHTQGAGAGATLAYLASSAATPGQCDRVLSPLVRLTPSSTLTVFNQFAIEPMSTGFFDRANVGLLDFATGARTTISPDFGRTYNASGPNGVCVTQGQPGWAGAGPGWLPSTWSASALKAGTFAGKAVRLDIAHGTDPTAELLGLWFDEVTLTNAEIQVADASQDVCPVVEGPVVRNDSAETLPGTPVSIDVLANDSSVNPPLAVQGVGQPGHGSASTDGNSVTYSPTPGFSGSDSFSYTACDASGLCGEAQVTVEVRCPATPTATFADGFEPAPAAGWRVDTPVNNLPVSIPWTPVVDPLTHGLTNSYFSDATTLDLKDDRLIAPPQDLSAGSRLIFWHRFFFEAGFDGGVIEVSRDGGATWVDVLAGGGSFIEGGYNDVIGAEFGSPIAGRQAWSGFSEFVDAMNRVEVDLGAFAGEGVLVRWRLAGDTLAAGSLPGAGWWIDDVEITNVLESPATCPLPPRTADDSAATEMDTPVTIDVLANDADPNGDPLTIGGVTQPAHGSAATDGSFVTYAPATGFVGSDSFQYSACDPGGLCTEATVTVTVTPPPADEPTRVSGNGWLPGADRPQFHVNADRGASPLKGRISYTSGDFRLKGSLDAVAFPSTTRATLEGSCEYGGGLPCRFSASAEDNGEPGEGTDRFEIQVFDAAGNPVHQGGGLLGGGNIRIR
jgi:hypothetical protein